MLVKNWQFMLTIWQENRMGSQNKSFLMFSDFAAFSLLSLFNIGIRYYSKKVRVFNY
jgi:hypothetical protein